MRKVVLVLSIAGMLQSVVHAGIVSSWAKSVDGANDVWTLTLTPTAGETMYGFDIGVFDTAHGGGVLSSGDVVYPDATNCQGPFVNNGNDFAAGSERFGNTTFLISKANLMTFGDGVDDADLYLSCATRGAGWNTSVSLLHIVVPHGTYTYTLDPDNNLRPGISVMQSDEGAITSGAYALAFVGVGSQEVPLFVPSLYVPEPTTLAMFGYAFLGLLAWGGEKGVRTIFLLQKRGRSSKLSPCLALCDRLTMDWCIT